MIYLLRMFIITLALSCLIHIFAILATPSFSNQKIWQKVTALSLPRALNTFSTYGDVVAVLGDADPGMVYALCWFDLSNGPVFMTSEASSTFWNVTLFDVKGQTVYSLHDGASKDGLLDLEIRRPSAGDTQDKEEDIQHPFALTQIDPTSPLPQPRPLSKKDIADIRERERLIDDEDPTVRAELRIDQGFAVFKVFRQSASLEQAILNQISATKCE